MGRRGRRFVLSLGAGVGLVALTVLVAVRAAPVIRGDKAVSDAARRFALAHDGWRSFMSAMTHSADSPILILMGVLAVVVLIWRRQWDLLTFLLVTATTGTILRLSVLALVHRPRPVDRLTATSGWAYPSGHTTSSALTAGLLVVLGFAVLRHRPARIVLVAVCGAWALLVGLSRVALVAHWPSDVLGGWLLATAVLAGYIPLLLTRRRNRGTEPR